MYLPRSIDSELEAWYASEHRKPLVLRGARQVGKSTSVRAFGRSKPLYIEVNLERFSDARLVADSRTPDEFLLALQLRNNIESFPKGTVLFLDEVQDAAKVVSWLRWFYEERSDLAVVAAGSLMDVRMRAQGFSFPVGRVTFAYLHPLSFVEFLSAIGQDLRRRFLQDAAASLRPIPESIHGELLELLKTYILVGGMPEAVVQHLGDGGLAGARRVHLDLLQAFSEDVQKYPGNQAAVEQALRNLKNHYGLRFKYERFSAQGNSRTMRDALDILEGAMLVHRALPTSSLRPPLDEKSRSAAKLLPLDIGLALSDFGLSPTEVQSVPLEDLLGGRFAECYVGQQLKAGLRAGDPLYFWVRESSNASAELDFLLPRYPTAVPIEVKSGKSGTLKSLHQFLKRSEGRVGLRLSSGNLLDQEQEVMMEGEPFKYRLVSLPLYLAPYLQEMSIIQ